MTVISAKTHLPNKLGTNIAITCITINEDYNGLCIDLTLSDSKIIKKQTFFPPHTVFSWRIITIYHQDSKV